MLIKRESLIYPLPSDASLCKAESEWLVTLPESYRRFLQQFNGCVPVKRVFVTHSGEYVVDRFLGYVEDYDNPLAVYDISVVLTQVEDRLFSDDSTIGVELLPIAALFAGDLLCLDFRTSGIKPKVVVWDAHASGELDPTVYEAFASFDDQSDIEKQVWEMWDKEIE